MPFFLTAGVLLLFGLPADATGPQSPAPLTLGECLREALEANPDVAAAAARAGGADEAAVAAGAVRWPRLDLLAGYALSERGQRLAQPSYAGEAISYEKDVLEAVVEARAPLWAGGRLVARERAASLGADASHAELVLSRQQLALNVAVTYIVALEQRAAIVALEGSLAALEGQLDLARALEDVGRIPPVDRLKVEVRAAAVRQQLSRARTDRELSLERLSALLGRDRNARRPEVDGAPPNLAPGQDVESMETSALSLRPEAASARLEVERARAELDAARGERWPALDAVARYTYRGAVPPEGGTPPGRYDWASGGLGLRLPVFTGGELSARIAQSKYRLSETEARLQAVELRVVGEVRAAVAAEAEAVERRAVAGRALEQARQAFEIEKASYELGRGAMNDVLDAQAALLDAQLSVAQAAHDVSVAGTLRTRAAGEDLVKALSGQETSR